MTVIIRKLLVRDVFRFGVVVRKVERLLVRFEMSAIAAVNALTCAGRAERSAQALTARS